MANVASHLGAALFRPWSTLAASRSPRRSVSSFPPLLPKNVQCGTPSWATSSTAPRTGRDSSSRLINFGSSLPLPKSRRTANQTPRLLVSSPRKEAQRTKMAQRSHRGMAARPETILFGASQQRMFILSEGPQTILCCDLLQYPNCFLREYCTSRISRVLRSALVRAREVPAGAARSACPCSAETKAIIAVIGNRSSEDSSVVEPDDINHRDTGFRSCSSALERFPS